MKFQKRLETESADFIADDSFRSALIRYKILKKHIKSMDLAAARERNVQPVEGECCICFEPFHFASRHILTACQHSFHPVCLVRALGTGFCTSCPLCRRTAAGLVPSGIDGDCLRFLAMVRVNANAVQNIHDQAVAAMERRVQELDAHRRMAGGLCMVCVFSPEVHRRVMIAEATETLAVLERMVRFDRLNIDGFRKITKKFDKKTGYHISPEMMDELHRASFFRDVSVFGNGRCAALRARIDMLLRDLRAGSRD